MVVLAEQPCMKGNYKDVLQYIEAIMSSCVTTPVSLVTPHTLYSV